MNITELKEKLTEFDMENFSNFQTDYRAAYSYFPSAEESARYQLNKDAETITALLSIIEEMRKCLKRYEPYCVPLLRPSTDPDMDPSEFYEIYEQWLAKETITATEQKLKELCENQSQK